MKSFSFTKTVNLPNQQSFRNFALNIDSPDIIKKELTFIVKINKLYSTRFNNIVNRLPLYNVSQLLAFFIHKRVYHSFDSIKFDFNILYSRIKLGLTFYLDYLNNKKYSFTKQKLNLILLYFWFNLDFTKYRFDDNTCLSCLYNIIPISIITSPDFNELINLGYPLKLKYSNSMDVNFQMDFILKLSNQFNIQL